MAEADPKAILPSVKTIPKVGPDGKTYQYDRRTHTYWDANAHAYVLTNLTAIACTPDDPQGVASKQILTEVPVASAQPAKSVGQKIGDRATAFGGGVSDGTFGKGTLKEVGKVLYVFGSGMGGHKVTKDDVDKYSSDFDKDHFKQDVAEQEHPGFYKAGEATAAVAAVAAPELRAARAGEAIGAARVGQVEVKAGEPVSVATGEYLESWHDFLVPSPALLLSGTRFMGLMLSNLCGANRPLGACQLSMFDEFIYADYDNKLTYTASNGRAALFERPFNFLPSANKSFPNLDLFAPWLRQLKLLDKNIVKNFAQFDDGYYRLQTIEDLNGNSIHLRRDAQGNLEKVETNSGLALAFTNDASGRRTGVTLVGRAGSQLDLARYVYDALGRMTAADCPYGMSVRYHWHPERDILLSWHNLTKRSETHFTYDDEGRVLHTRTNGIWNDDRFRYDPVNRETTYLPSGDARLAQRFRYDANDNVTHEIDALGGTLQHTFDAAGFETATTDANGHVTTMAYDIRGNVKRHVDAEGRGSTYGWGPHGEVDVVIDGAGHIRKYENDERGNCLAETDAEGHITRYVRDERGRLLRTILPDGAEESRAYDAHGRLTSITDARGGLTRFAYDSFGRIVETTDALGHVTRTEYNAGAGGFVTPSAVVRPDGVRISRAFTEDGVLASVTDGEGRTWSYTYGAFDVLQAIEDPKGGRLSFAYDGEGRVIAVTNQMGVTYHLIRDAAGRVIAEEDFDGRRTDYTRDPGGRVVETKKPDGVRLAYTYDRTDKLTSIKGYAADDPEKTRPLDETHYWYDGRGLLIRASNLAALVEFERDGNGRIVAETVNGRRVESEFDARGNRIERRIGQGEPGKGLVRYAHDPLGMVSKITIDDHTPLTFTRDALGREKHRASAKGFRLDQSWDAVGQLVHQRAGIGPAERRYAWDSVGAPTRIDDAIWGETTYRYDANGQVAEARFGDGFAERFEYDAARNVAGISLQGPQDRAGYGKLLAWRSTAGGVVQLSYGPNGERVALTHDKCGRVVARRVDRKGFRPKKWDYSWDAHDRLVRCDNPDGETWFYRYDPFGRRLSRVRKLSDRELAWTSQKYAKLVPASANEATKIWIWPEPPNGAGAGSDGHPPVVGTHFLWDGIVLCEEAPMRLDGSLHLENSVKWHYEPSSCQPLVKQQKSNLAFVVNDHLGSPRELFDEEGHPLWASITSTWGILREKDMARTDLSSGAIYKRKSSPTDKEHSSLNRNNICSLRFAGQMEDKENGLHYNFARYYDPQTGSYATPDRMGLRGGLRPHGYVNIPTIEVDVFGLQAAGAQARQATMLDQDVGYNVSPLSTDRYPAIGRAGTYITDKKALTDVLGDDLAHPSNDPKKIAVLERNLGLQPGSLKDGFKIRKISGIKAMSPRSPFGGSGASAGAGTNNFFLGGGQGLPGGGPEMIVNSVPTVDSPGVSIIGAVK